MNYYFFNSVNGDRKYNAESFAEWLFPFFTTGVFNGGFQVLADSGMSIKVSEGYANIEGKVAYSNVIETITLDTAHPTLSRIDNIVLRKDEINREITLNVVKGTSSENPVAPGPNRSEGIYELVIAQVLIKPSVIEITQSSITDTRLDNELCGYVVSTIKEIDFSQIVAQWESFIAEFEESSLNDFETWFEGIKGKLGEDVAGSLQTQIDKIKDSFLTEEDIDNILNLSYEEGGN